APKTVVVEKDDSGKWTSNDPNVNVNPDTGVITIDADKVKDGTEVNVVATDDAGNRGSAENTTPVNQAPVANNSEITTPEDTKIEGKLPEATDKENDPVTYTVNAEPTNGTVVIDTNGNYTYTPKDNFHGKDEFTYTVNDGKGGTNTYTVTVNVTPVNDAPVGEDDTIGTPINTPITKTLPIATDADGDNLTYGKGDKEPTNGKVEINEDGSYTYTPNNEFSGEDSFTYTVKDGKGGEDTHTVTVNVEPRPIKAETTAVIEDGDTKGNPDNQINSEDLKTITVSGSVINDKGTQTVETGKEVKITLTDAEGNQIETTTTIKNDGTWETNVVDISTLKDGKITATATTAENADGSKAEGSDDSEKDTVAPTPEVKINDDGSVTITPDTATTPDVKKVDVTYTPEGSDAPKTVVVEKDDSG
ncbi:Ig-like domain-containing protein, partial [Chelonobacter oris]|uniref:Ig-like domain-containing protein n=1 Tax=Chelonobacter oris TaxID=505317 RepID=UPI002449D1D6